MSLDSAALRRQFPLLVNHPQLHYLDNAASTQLPESVLQAQWQYQTRQHANADRSLHWLGEQASAALGEARAQVAQYLNAASVDEVIFTSGTTAAINLLANSLVQQWQPGDQVLISAAEHHSNILPWQMLRRHGIELIALDVDSDGCIDFATLTAKLSERCKLVAITHASNVTGMITPLAALLARAREVGALVFLDGAQMAAHSALDMQSLGVDFYAFSGHKCYAPNGIGVLWGRAALLASMAPAWGGGGMIERVSLTQTRYASGFRRFEAGTPPVAQAVALGAALAWLSQLDSAALQRHQRRLRDRLVAGLSALPGVRVLAAQRTQPAVALCSFTVEGLHPHDIVQLLSEAQVAVRGGHLCAQPLMDALALEGVTRASLAIYNNDEDVDALLAALRVAMAWLK